MRVEAHVDRTPEATDAIESPSHGKSVNQQLSARADGQQRAEGTEGKQYHHVRVR